MIAVAVVTLTVGLTIAALAGDALGEWAWDRLHQ